MPDSSKTDNALEIPHISKEDTILKQGQGALLFDVRTAEEQAGGIIQGAICLDSREVPQRLGEFGKDKQREIILYCKSGGRSGAVGEFLKAAGFVNVYNAGGYEDLC